MDRNPSNFSLILNLKTIVLRNQSFGSTHFAHFGQRLGFCCDYVQFEVEINCGKKDTRAFLGVLKKNVVFLAKGEQFLQKLGV